jgi:hypothetical protein
MKVEISIEFDKESASVFMAALREISAGFKHLQSVFDASDWSVSTQRAPEPKPKPKTAVKRKPRAGKTLRGTVLTAIKKNKQGMSRKELQEQTGFTGKQLSNYVYQLKKQQKIEVTKDGVFKPL